MVKINPNSLEALKKINEAGAIRVTDKVELFKELVKAGNTPNEAKKIVIQRFNLQRGKATGTPKWMTRGKKELIAEGFNYKDSPRGPEASGETVQEKAQKKRKQVIGKGSAFEERIKKEKTKTGFGKKFETAHTANIFQAKKLGINYPVDALAVQATKVNQEVAEILNEELEPLYKKQLELRNKLKKNNTFALRKELDDINFKISETVATGGKQGSKAANVLKPIIVDPKTLDGKILDLGFKTTDEVMSIPGATTKGTKAGTIEDLMARMNIQEQVLKKAKDVKIPEKSQTREMFKTAFKKVPKKGKVGLAAAAITGVAGKGIADELPIEYNDEIGAFVDPKTDDKVSQATLLDWAANNPIPTAAVASAPLLSKTVRKGTGKLLSGLLSALGTSAAGLTFAGLTVKGNLDEGKNIVDATVDPMVGLELLYPEAVKRFGGKGLQNALGRALSLGRVGTMMTPVGLGIGALGLGKMGIEALIDERERIKNMTPEELEIFRAEQEEQMGMSA